MAAGKGEPALVERLRVGLRVIATFGAYFAYRSVGDTERLAGLLLGAGVALFSFVAIDRFTICRDEPLGRLRVGAAAVGVVFVGAGVYLAVR